jgi:signal transduction histidine kinase
MNIFKNNDVKKLTLVLLLFLLIIIATMFSTASIIINNYKNYLYDYNAKVISLVVSIYPDAEDDIVKEIMNSDLAKGRDILKKYGIDKDTMNNLVKPINQEYYSVLKVIIIFGLLIFVPLIIILFVFIKTIYNKIKKLNDYTLNIAYKDYTIDIRDNDEGDISILKNRLYDITRILKENNELLENDKAVLKNAIADISHQLKTPLTSLYLCNEILTDEKDETKRLYFLDKMHNELERIEWLISSLLTMSKLDSKTITLKHDNINVASLVNSSIDCLTALIKDKQININVNGNDEVTFIGDFYWMRETLINIIKNAIEHSNIFSTIDITFEDNPLYTKIDICDAGEGIDKNDILHIFERFYKAKGSSKNSVGIGLALAKSIVNSQNGDISVKSKKGKYTTFTIKIYKNEY